MAYSQAGDTQKTEEAYRQAIEADPTRADAYFSLAQFLVDHKQMAEALQVYMQMTRQPVLAYDAYVSIGFYTRQDKPGKAEESFRQALKITSDRPEAYLNLAQLLADQKRIGEAIQVYSQMAQQPQLAYEAYVSLGDLYARQADYDQAERAYRQAIELDSQQERAYLMLAFLYRDQNKLASMEELIQQALAVDPQALESYWHLAQLREQQRQWAEAIRLYCTFAERQPDPVWASVAFAYAGRLLLEQERYSEAEEMLRNAMQSNPAYADAHMLMGSLYASQQNDGEAELAFQRAIEVDPARADGYYTLAQWYETRGRWNEAIQLYHKIAELDSEEACFAYSRIGYVCHKLGRIDEMRAACARVISLAASVDLPDRIRLQGLAHFRREEYPEAVLALKQALETSPADFKAHFYLALTLLCQGERAQAEKQLEQGMHLAQFQADYAPIIEEAELLAARDPEVAGAGEMLQALVKAKEKAI
jgi:superkiller protein 3